MIEHGSTYLGIKAFVLLVYQLDAAEDEVGDVAHPRTIRDLCFVGLEKPQSQAAALRERHST